MPQENEKRFSVIQETKFFVEGIGRFDSQQEADEGIARHKLSLKVAKVLNMENNIAHPVIGRIVQHADDLKNLLNKELS